MDTSFEGDWQKERFVLIHGMKERVLIHLSLRLYRDRYLPQMREHVDELDYGLSEIDDMEATIDNLLEKLEHTEEQWEIVERLVDSGRQATRGGSGND
jgi:hypothetical protein